MTTAVLFPSSYTTPVILRRSDEDRRRISTLTSLVDARSLNCLLSLASFASFTSPTSLHAEATS